MFSSSSSSSSSLTLCALLASALVVGSALATAPVRVVFYGYGIDGGDASQVEAARRCTSNDGKLARYIRGGFEQTYAIDDRGCLRFDEPRTFAAKEVTVSWSSYQKLVRLTGIAMPAARCLSSSSADGCEARGALVDFPMATTTGSGAHPVYTSSGLGHTFTFTYSSSSSRYELRVDGSGVLGAFEDLASQGSLTFALPADFTLTAASIRFSATALNTFVLHTSDTCGDAAAAAVEYYSSGAVVDGCHSDAVLRFFTGYVGGFRLETLVPTLFDGMSGSAQRLCAPEANAGATTSVRGARGLMTYNDQVFCPSASANTCAVTLRENDKPSGGAGVCVRGSALTRFAGARLSRNAAGETTAIELVPSSFKDSTIRAQLTPARLSYATAFVGADLFVAVETGANGAANLVVRRYEDAPEELARVAFAYASVGASSVDVDFGDGANVLTSVRSVVLGTRRIETFANDVCAGPATSYPYNKNVCHPGELFTYVKPGSVNFGSFLLDSSSSLRLAVEDAGAGALSTLVVVAVVGGVALCVAAAAALACACVLVARRRSTSRRAGRPSSSSSSSRLPTTTTTSRSVSSSRRGSRYGVHASGAI